MAEKKSEISPRSGQYLARRAGFGSPLRMLDRFAEEMDRMFDEFGFGRGWRRMPGFSEMSSWTPRVDVVQRNDQLIITADLPGMRKEDVQIEVTDNAVTLQGERRREHEEERDGIYRAERSYGSFYRTIPLPEGAITDQAKATFKDGVLEITMPAPPEQVSRGRRLEISEGSTTR